MKNKRKKKMVKRIFWGNHYGKLCRKWGKKQIKWVSYKLNRDKQVPFEVDTIDNVDWEKVDFAKIFQECDEEVK